MKKAAVTVLGTFCVGISSVPLADSRGPIAESRIEKEDFVCEKRPSCLPKELRPFVPLPAVRGSRVLGVFPSLCVLGRGFTPSPAPDWGVRGTLTDIQRWSVALGHRVVFQCVCAVCSLQGRWYAPTGNV